MGRYWKIVEADPQQKNNEEITRASLDDDHVFVIEGGELKKLAYFHSQEEKWQFRPVNAREMQSLQNLSTLIQNFNKLKEKKENGQ